MNGSGRGQAENGTQTWSKATIGIPLFENRISPRCEYASRMLVLEIEGSREVSRSYINLTELNPLQKINFIIGQQINAVICAGISGFWKRMLDANRIRVIQASTYDVENALEQVTCRGSQTRQSGKGQHRRMGRGYRRKQAIQRGPRPRRCRRSRLSIAEPEAGPRRLKRPEMRNREQ